MLLWAATSATASGERASQAYRCSKPSCIAVPARGVASAVRAYSDRVTLTAIVACKPMVLALTRFVGAEHVNRHPRGPCARRLEPQTTQTEREVGSSGRHAHCAHRCERADTRRDSANLDAFCAYSSVNLA